jgi:hypothetical protein
MTDRREFLKKFGAAVSLFGVAAHFSPSEKEDTIRVESQIHVRGERIPVSRDIPASLDAFVKEYGEGTVLVLATSALLVRAQVAARMKWSDTDDLEAAMKAYQLYTPKPPRRR